MLGDSWVSIGGVKPFTTLDGTLLIALLTTTHEPPGIPRSLNHEVPIQEPLQGLSIYDIGTWSLYV